MSDPEDLFWIKYMTIDEETFEFYLDPNAPEEVKEAYKEAMERERKSAGEDGLIAK